MVPPEVIKDMERQRQKRQERPQLPLYAPDFDRDERNQEGGYGTPAPEVIERGVCIIKM
jgi:hypothetical protein